MFQVKQRAAGWRALFKKLGALVVLCALPLAFPCLSQAQTPMADRDGNGLIEIDSLLMLHNMRHNLAGTSYKASADSAGNSSGCPPTGGCVGYELARDLDFNVDDDGSTWSGSADEGYTLDSGDRNADYFPVDENGAGGWLPIGNETNSFVAVFDGNGNTIRNLAIRRDQTYVGLFGTIDGNAAIRNLGLTDNLANYTGSNLGISGNIGGLVGAQFGGLITASYATGAAAGGDGNRDGVGGLVGFQGEGGSITASWATGTAAGGDGNNDRVGGLVGNQNGSITASYATGAAYGGDGGFDYVGGLVGLSSYGTITASYATGAAEGGDGDYDKVGGLVGSQSAGGSITASYATGAAAGGDGDFDYVGGLVGEQQNGLITASYATGAADGDDGTHDSVGGLVGQKSLGLITASYATGAAAGGDGNYDRVGGLVGWQNSGAITANYATGAAAGGDGDLDYVGGLVGLQFGGSITANYATGGADGGDGNGDRVGGLVGQQQGGGITASYAMGAADGGDGYSDIVGGLMGFQSGGTIMASYDFVRLKGIEFLGVSGSSRPPGVVAATQLTQDNADSVWDDDGNSTLGAWDFGTESQIPALKYSDYDGSMDFFDCDQLPANACGTLLPGQDVVSVGGPSAVGLGETVQLAGSLGFGRVLIESWSWRQLAGPDVTLSNANAREPSFTAPATSSLLVFELTATDGDGLQYIDRISLVVMIKADRDGNGLLEIDSLLMLHNMRHNLDGTSYKTSTTSVGNSLGCPDTGCIGYELTQDLDFDRNNDGSTWSGNFDEGYTLDADDSKDTYFPVLNGAGGWLPIGGEADPFVAVFDGNSHTISNLAIRRDQTYIGLFGRTGRGVAIRNLGLIDNLADYTNFSDNGIYIGGLAGYQDGGSITASYATGAAAGGDGDLDYVGGLVGRQGYGSITASYATGDVDGGDGDYDKVGGLVGILQDLLTASWATGVVAGGDGHEDSVGGLVGSLWFGSITASYATGAAVGGGGNNDEVGGLVGAQNGSIGASYATGTADGGAGNYDYVGGLVGEQVGGPITASYATGAAAGGNGDYDYVGGLVGRQGNLASITASHATGAADGGDGTDDEVGGLVGRLSGGTITAGYATGAADGGDGNADRVGGLVGRLTSGGTIIASYATGAVSGGDGHLDEVGGLVGNQNGSITASYATGAVNGEEGNNDAVGGLVGYLARGSLTASYGFGGVMGEIVGSAGSARPPGIDMAAQLTADNAESAWSNASNNTLGAWDFGDETQIPALNYADYDDAVGDIFACSDFPAYACGTLLPGQRHPVSVSVAKLEVDEGGSASYNLRLTSAPIGRVEVRVVVPSDYQDSLRASPAILFFAADAAEGQAEHWRMAHTVTLSLREDQLSSGVRVVAIGHAMYPSAPGDDGLEAPSVEVTLIDNEERPSLRLVLAPATAAEGSGGTDGGARSREEELRVTAELEGPARSIDTVVPLTVGAGGDTADQDDYRTDLPPGAVLTIPAEAAASEPLEFVVTLFQDLIAEGDESFTLGASNALLGSASATFVIRDDDRAGVGVTLRPQNLRQGGEISYDLVLGSEPTAAVEVAVEVVAAAGSGVRAADVTAVPAVLRFTRADWHEAQTVMLRAAPEVAAFGGLEINHRLTSADLIYAGLDPVSVRLELINVAATLSVAELKVNEGGSASYRLSLTSQPAGAVTVAVMIPSAHGGIVAADRTTLTFNEGNWSAGVEVTVTLEDDDFYNGRRELTIVHSVTSSEDPNYRGLEVPGIEVTLIDDENRPSLRLVLAPASAAEGSGGTDGGAHSREEELRVTAELEGPARSIDTVVPLTIGAGGDTAGQDDYRTDLPPGAALTIPAEAAASEPLEFVVTLFQDLIAEGDESFTLRASNALLGSASATFVIRDDDRAGVGVTLRPQNLRQGGEISYDLALESEPTAAVEVAVEVVAAAGSGVRAADVTAVPAVLRFTRADWHKAQTVMLRAVPEVAAFGGLEINHRLTSADLIYAGLDPVSVRLELINVAATLSVAELKVNEGGSASYRLSLTSQPAGAVTVAVMIPSAYGGIVAADRTTLTFNEGNWSAGVEVTVTLEDDDFYNGRRELTIVHSVTSSEDPNYRGLEVPGIEVTLIDGEERPSLRLVLAPATAAEGSGGTDGGARSREEELRVTAELEGPARSIDTVVTLTIGAGGDTADQDDYRTDLPPEAALTIPAEAAASEPLEFVVTLFQDLIAEGDESFTLRASNALLGSASATFVIRDDDRAGVGVTLRPQNLRQGGEISYDLVLGSEPTAAVEVAVEVVAAAGSGVRAADVTAVPAVLRFTRADWHEAQTVMLRAAPEVAAFGGLEINHRLTSADLIYAGLDPVSVRLELINVAATLSVAELKVNEGGSASYRLSLTSQPAGAVTVAVMIPSAHGGIVAADRTTLTFNEGNWSAGVEVTVTLEDDDFYNGRRELTIVHSVTSSEDPNYRGLEVPGIEVTLIDDENRPSLRLVLAPASAAEGSGGTDGGARSREEELRVTAELEGPARSIDTVVPLTIGAGGDTAGQDDYRTDLPPGAVLTIPAEAAASEPLEFVVTLFQDLIAEGDESFTLGASNALLGSASATFVIRDDDRAGVGVTLRPQNLRQGGEISYDLVLGSEPTAAVEVAVEVVAAAGSGVRAADVTAVPAVLRFTRADWHEAQTVMLRAAPEVAAFGGLEINHRLTSADLIYAGLDPVSVRLELINVAATLSVAELKVNEGGSASYRLSLTSQPAGAVTVAVMIPSAHGGIVAADRTTLTFNEGNWSAGVEVTVTLEDDDFYNGRRELTIVHSVTSSEDPNYRGLEVPGIEVTLIDDENRPSLRLVLAPASAAEGSGGTDGGAHSREEELRVTAELEGPARSIDTVVPLTIGAGGDTAGQDDYRTDLPPGAALTIPAEAAASEPLEFVVTLFQDLIAEGDESFTLRASNALLGSASATFVIRDDDRAGVGVTLRPQNLRQGGEISYDLALESEPTAAVEVAVEVVAAAGSGVRAADVTAVPAVLRFTRADWHKAQTVMLRAVPEVAAFGGLEINHRLTSADLIYAGLDPVSVRLELINVAATLSVAELKVNEGGSASYRLSLTSQPAGAVTVAVMIPSAYGGIVAADRTTLTFNEGNWSAGVEVTVTLEDDDFYNGRRELTIVHSVTSSEDPNYRGLEVPGIEVTLIDDENRPSLRLVLAPASAAEGSGGTDGGAHSREEELRVTAELEGPARSIDTVVPLTVGAGGDTADQDDYRTDLPPGAVLTIPAEAAASEPLEFVVTLFQDLIAEGDESFTLGASNALLGSASATFVIRDDDRAGVGVTLRPQNLRQGGEISYDLVLGSEPTAAVEVAVEVVAAAGSGVRAADVTAVPAVLRFTRADWHEAQTVMLRAAPEVAAFGGLEINHRLTSADLIYAGLDPVSVRLELINVAATLSVAELKVNEGGSASYRLSLTSQPAGAVTVAVMIPSAHGGIVAADRTTLTFNEGNWSAGVEVTVTLEDDDFYNGRRELTIVHSVTSSEDPNYRGLEVPGIEVTLIDGEERPSLRLVLAPATAAEGSGGTDGGARSREEELRVTAELEGPARSIDTVVPLTIGAGGDTAGQDDYRTDLPPGAALTIPAEAAASEPLEFVVTLFQDLIAEGDESFTLRASNALLGSASATFVIRDDDRAGVGVTLRPQNLRQGGEISYDLALESEPTAAVEVAVEVVAAAGSGVRAADVTAVPAVLRFTRADWHKAQTVMLRAVPEVAAFGGLEINHRLTSADLIYAGLDPVSVRLELINVAATLSVAELKVNEGGSASYRLSLTSQPAGAVTVAVMIPSAHGGIVAADRTTLTFNEGNWSAGVEVTVTLEDDDFYNGRRELTIVHSVTSSEDPNYRGLEVPGIEVTLIDGEERPSLRLVLAPATAAEGSGGTDGGARSREEELRVTAELEGPARSIDTVVTLTIGAGGDTADQDDYRTDLPPEAALTIPAEAAASEPLEFVVTLFQDLIAEGDESFTLRASNALLGSASATFVIRDDDRAGVGVTLRPQNLRQGGEISYDLALESEPTAAVEVAVEVVAAAGSGVRAADVTAVPAVLRFTRADWHKAQTVMLRAVPEVAAFGGLEINHRLTSADLIYAGLDPVSVRLELINVAATLSVAELKVNEGGSASYRLSLTSQPAGAVTVAVMIPSAHGGIVAADRATLTFNEGNWSAGVEVTVTLEDDDFYNGRRELTIVHSVTSSEDPNYRGLEVPGIEVTLIDDEERPELILSLSPDNAREGSSSDPSEETSQNLIVGATAMLKGDLRSTETVVALAVGGVAGDTADQDDYQTNLSTDATLIIPAMERSAPLTFNLTLIEDLIDEGDQSFTITASNDLLGSAAAIFAIADDDRAGVAVTLTPQNLREGGEISYTVVLGSEPTADVEVAVAVMAVAGSEALPADVTAMPAPLTFTSANWHEPQRVTLSVEVDVAVFGELDINHSLTSTDANYNGLPVDAIRLKLTEADTTRQSLEVEVSPKTLVVAKGGSGQVTLVISNLALDEDPTGFIVLRPDHPDVTVAPRGSGTIDRINSRFEQRLGVRAAEDADREEYTVRVEVRLPGESVVSTEFTVDINEAPQYKGMTELTVYESGDNSVMGFPLSVVDPDGGKRLLVASDLRLEVVGFGSEVFFVQALDHANSYFTLQASAIKREFEDNGNSLALTLTLTGKLATPLNSVVELRLFGVTDGFYDFEQRLTVEVKNRPPQFELATTSIKVFLYREPATIQLDNLEPGSSVLVLEAPDDLVVKFDATEGEVTLTRLAIDLDEDQLTDDEVKLVALDAQGGRKVVTITVERPPLLPQIVPQNPRLIAAGELRTWPLRLERNTELDVIWDVTGGAGSVDYEIARTAGGHAELALSALISAQAGDEFELLLTAEVGAEDGGYRRTALLPVAVVAAKAKPHLKLSVTVPDAADPAKAATVSSFALSESISVKAELEGAVPSLEDLGNVATLSFQIRVAKLGSDGVPLDDPLPLIFMAESRVEDGATALDIAPVLVGNLTTNTLGLSVGSVVEVSIGHLPRTDSTEVSNEIIAGASLRLLVSAAAGRRDADNDGLADGGESEPGALVRSRPPSPRCRTASSLCSRMRCRCP